MIQTGVLYKTLDAFINNNEDMLDINQKEVISLIIDRCIQSPIIKISQTKVLDRLSEILLDNKTLIKKLKIELNLINTAKYNKKWSKNIVLRFQVYNILYPNYSKYRAFTSRQLVTKEFKP